MTPAKITIHVPADAITLAAVIAFFTAHESIVVTEYFSNKSTSDCFISSAFMIVCISFGDKTEPCRDNWKHELQKKNAKKIRNFLEENRFLVEFLTSSMKNRMFDPIWLKLLYPKCPIPIRMKLAALEPPMKIHRWTLSLQLAVWQIQIAAAIYHE